MAVSEDLLAGRALLYQAVLGVTKLIIDLLVLLAPGAEALSLGVPHVVVGRILSVVCYQAH